MCRILGAAAEVNVSMRTRWIVAGVDGEHGSSLLRTEARYDGGTITVGAGESGWIYRGLDGGPGRDRSTPVLITRKLLILRMARRPKMPSLPGRLYDFCTVNLFTI